MKPFQPRTPEQQRKNYIKACKARMTQELRALEDMYREEHETHAKLHFNRCRIDERITKIQNRVADAADKEFGGWDVWRHDETLLAQVVKRMDDAVTDERTKLEAINLRMEKVMAEYHAECRKISQKYHTLMRTAR